MWVMAWWTRCVWLVVVALWLPASMHCPLEAAGLFHTDGCSPKHGASCCASHGSDSDEPDACPVCLSVEDGALFRLPEILLVKPAGGLPLFLVWEADESGRTPAMGEDGKRASTGEDWRPPWWCRQRVAACPRAPGFHA